MEYFVGLDVSLRSCALCIVDGRGKVCIERDLACEVDEIAGCLHAFGHPIERIGFEAGALSQHLFFGLQDKGFDIVCMEARQVSAALSAMRNKTDKTDAKGIAQILRTGWFSPVHMKSREAHGIRALLSTRKALLKKTMDLRRGKWPCSSTKPTDRGWRTRRRTPKPTQRARATTTADPRRRFGRGSARCRKRQKLRLAKHGNAEARRLLLKEPDPALHLQVLNNPGITGAEVAALIKGGAASPGFVRAVASRAELVGQGSVMEALVLSPKTPLDIAVKLMGQVPLALAKRIAKTGKGRGAVVQAAKRRVTR